MFTQTLFSGCDQRSGQHRSKHADRADGGWAAGESAGAFRAAGAGGETSQWKSQWEGPSPQGTERHIIVVYCYFSTSL